MVADAPDVSRDGRIYVGNHVKLTQRVTRQGRVCEVGKSFRVDELNPAGTQAKCFHPGFDPFTCWLPVSVLEDWS